MTIERLKVGIEGLKMNASAFRAKQSDEKQLSHHLNDVVPFNKKVSSCVLAAHSLLICILITHSHMFSSDLDSRQYIFIHLPNFPPISNSDPQEWIVLQWKTKKEETGSRLRWKKEDKDCCKVGKRKKEEMDQKKPKWKREKEMTKYCK